MHHKLSTICSLRFLKTSCKTNIRLETKKKYDITIIFNQYLMFKYIKIIPNLHVSQVVVSDINNFIHQCTSHVLTYYILLFAIIFFIKQQFSIL